MTSSFASKRLLSTIQKHFPQNSSTPQNSHSFQTIQSSKIQLIDASINKKRTSNSQNVNLNKTFHLMGKIIQIIHKKEMNSLNGMKIKNDINGNKINPILALGFSEKEILNKRNKDCYYLKNKSQNKSSPFVDGEGSTSLLQSRLVISRFYSTLHSEPASQKEIQPSLNQSNQINPSSHSNHDEQTNNTSKSNSDNNENALYSKLKNAFAWFCIFVSLFSILYIAMESYILSLKRVTGPSMLPTLHSGERCFVLRAKFRKIIENLWIEELKKHGIDWDVLKNGKNVEKIIEIRDQILNLEKELSFSLYNAMKDNHGNSPDSIISPNEISQPNFIDSDSSHENNKNLNNYQKKNDPIVSPNSINHVQLIIENGPIVVYAVPRDNQKFVVKRLRSILYVPETNQFYFWMEGDNSKESTDSRTYGYIIGDRFFGMAWATYSNSNGFKFLWDPKTVESIVLIDKPLQKIEKPPRKSIRMRGNHGDVSISLKGSKTDSSNESIQEQISIISKDVSIEQIFKESKSWKENNFLNEPHPKSKPNMQVTP